MTVRTTLAWSCLAATLVLAPAAHAGAVVAIGDGNITDNLGSDPNTERFFLNMLGAGTQVGVLDLTDAGYGSAGNTDDELVNFYNSIGGVSASLLAGTVTAGMLSGLDLFLAPLPDDNFSGAEISALSSFTAGSGVVAFLGENDNVVFNIPNAAINGALSGLGTGMMLVDSCQSSATAVAGGAFNAGAPSVRYACGSFVDGGTAEYESGGRAVIASSGAAVVPVPATLPLIAGGLGLLGLLRRSRTA